MDEDKVRFDLAAAVAVCVVPQEMEGLIEEVTRTHFGKRFILVL